MNTIQFAQQISAEDVGLPVHRWVEHLQDFIIQQTVYLVRHIDRLPESMQTSYWSVLQDVLTEMPEEASLEVSTELFQLITQHAPAPLVPLIRERILKSGNG